MAEITLFKGNRKKIVRYDDILYLKAENKYTEVILVSDERLYSSKCLKTLEACIPLNGFVRIHRKYCINLRHVTEYQMNGERYVCMSNGIRIPVSVRKKPSITARIKDYFK